jgi:hypothetical protein
MDQILQSEELLLHSHSNKLQMGVQAVAQFVLQKLNQAVCHTVALPFTLKTNLTTKEELWKLKYFTMQKYSLQKNPLKETKILQDIL